MSVLSIFTYFGALRRKNELEKRIRAINYKVLSLDRLATQISRKTNLSQLFNSVAGVPAEFMGLACNLQKMYSSRVSQAMHDPLFTEMRVAEAQKIIQMQSAAAEKNGKKLTNDDIARIREMVNGSMGRQRMQEMSNCTSEELINRINKKSQNLQMEGQDLRMQKDIITKMEQDSKGDTAKDIQSQDFSTSFGGGGGR